MTPTQNGRDDPLEWKFSRKSATHIYLTKQFTRVRGGGSEALATIGSETGKDAANKGGRWFRKAAAYVGSCWNSRLVINGLLRESRRP